MRSYGLHVEVTGRVGLEGTLETAATVYLPDRLDGPVTVMVGLPGGTYSRAYYDIRTLAGYSQAGYHTDRGVVFVACDHLGVGESSQPDPYALTYEHLGAGNHAAVSTILGWLRNGTLADSVPAVEVENVIGMGQSMGGCLLTVQQARHHTFDGVAFLGWSGIASTFPAPDGSRVTYPIPPRGSDLRGHADQMLRAMAHDRELISFFFHAPNEEPELVDADLAYSPDGASIGGGGAPPWRSPTMPPCALTMTNEGVVAEEAAAIDVPVLIACGERDVVPDPWAEPSAYRSSHDVTVFVVPAMCHMHNFARTRELLWERIAGFAQNIRQQIALAGPDPTGREAPS
jgi:pimeloyl-ACP methyl ester carboxylesterase